MHIQSLNFCSYIHVCVKYVINISILVLRGCYVHIRRQSCFHVLKEDGCNWNGPCCIAKTECYHIRITKYIHNAQYTSVRQGFTSVFLPGLFSVRMHQAFFVLAPGNPFAPLGNYEIHSTIISTWPKPYSAFTRTTQGNLHLCTTWLARTMFTLTLNTTVYVHTVSSSS